MSVLTRAAKYRIVRAEVPTTVTRCYPLVNWARVTGPYDTVWANVHDAANGQSPSMLLFGQAASGKNSALRYLIHRGAIYFDTSAIDPSKTIVSATLHTYSRGQPGWTGGGMYWSPSTIYLVDVTSLNYPITVGDYGTLLSKTNSFLSQAFTDITTYITHDVELPSHTRATINKGGTTYFGVREEHDLNDDPTIATLQNFGGIFEIQPAGKELSYLDVEHTL